MKAFERVVRGLAQLGVALAAIATIASMLLIGYSVFMRYFLSSPIFWAEEISVQLLVFATLFGLSLLVHHGQLVTIDFLPQALGPRARHALFTALGVVMLALFAFLFWMGIDWVNRPEVRMELGATTQLPRWYNYSVLPAAMAAMTWHQFAAVLRHARVAITGAAQ